MKDRTRRRITGFSILALASAIFLLILAIMRVQLRPGEFFSGWILFVTMLFLAIYNWRKQFPVPPLISSKIWLQCHIYAGFFTVVAFWAHTGSLWAPTGWFERALWLLYMGVAVSGVVGLFITRTFPQRLTSRGEEVVFERIPEVLRDLRLKVESLAEGSIQEGGGSTIAHFYTERLRWFFLRPRNSLRHIVGYHSSIARRMNELDDQYRYLDESGKKALAEIARCVRAKDALDHQYALQLVLKLWLFVHIPLTYAVIVFALVHIMLVYAFRGGIV